MSALDERYQRARDAAYDAAANEPSDRFARVLIETAIETATRVHVDDAIVQASRPPGPRLTPGSVVWTRMRAKIVRAFEAAGFEVTT